MTTCARESAYRMEYSYMTLQCRDCGSEFVFTAGEQAFYAEKGFTNRPSRCPACRSANTQRRDSSSSYASNGGNSYGNSYGGNSYGGGAPRGCPRTDEFSRSAPSHRRARWSAPEQGGPPDDPAPDRHA